MAKDITDQTSGVQYSTGEEAFSPKDTGIEDVTKSPKVDFGSHTSEVLDKMFAERSGAAKNDSDDDAVEQNDAESAAEENSGSAENDEAGTKKSEDSAPKNKAQEEAESKQRAEQDAAAKDKAEGAAKAEPEDELAKVKLPPHAKPNTVKSFDRVKEIAREQIAAKDKEIADLRSRLPKPGEEVPAEVKKELDDLRAFRRAHDYQNDPEFKKQYVDPIAANESSIFAKLKAANVGLSDEHVAKMKEIGLDKLDWEPILSKVPAQVRRSIEALLLDSERISDKKAQALEAMKNAPQEYAEKQKKALEEKSATEASTVKSIVEGQLEKTDWFRETPVPPSATAEQKAEIEAKNAFFKEQRARYESLLNDSTPEMRGTMIAATLMAFQLQHKADYFEKKLKEAEARVQKLTKASSTLSTRTAPASDSKTKTSSTKLIRSGADALDELHRQQQASDNE